MNDQQIEALRAVLMLLAALFAYTMGYGIGRKHGYEDGHADAEEEFKNKKD